MTTPAEKATQLAAAHFGLNPYDIRSKSRSRTVTKARHYAYHALRSVYGWSYEEIASAISQRHHTTVMYGCSQVQADNPVVRALSKWRDDLANSAGLDRSSNRPAPSADSSKSCETSDDVPQDRGPSMPDVHRTELQGNAADSSVCVACNGHGMRKDAADARRGTDSKTGDQSDPGTGLYRFTGSLTRRDLIEAVKEFAR